MKERKDNKLIYEKELNFLLGLLKVHRDSFILQNGHRHCESLHVRVLPKNKRMTMVL